MAGSNLSSAPPDFMPIKTATSPANDAISEGAIVTRLPWPGGAAADEFALDPLVYGRIYDRFVRFPYDIAAFLAVVLFHLFSKIVYRISFLENGFAFVFLIGQNASYRANTPLSVAARSGNTAVC